MSSNRRALFALGILALLGGLARAQAGESFTVVPAKSKLSYHLIHKLHRVDGISRKVEGKAKLLPGGAVQILVRAPVESFDSGNVNRDAHMKETVEAARFPLVEVKAVGQGITIPQRFPATLEKKLKAQVSFHGVQQVLEVPVKLVFESAKRVRATATLPISLERFKVERPSLMFVKVDDAVKIEVDLVLQR